MISIKNNELGITLHFYNGLLHKEDGPAVLYRDGTKEWWFNGIRHNNNGPAIVTGSHSIFIKNGKVDRYTTTWSPNNGEKKILLDKDFIINSIIRIKDIIDKTDNILFDYENNNELSSYLINYNIDHCYKGILHNSNQIDENERPSIIDNNGYKYWFMYGVKHRNNFYASYHNIYKREIWYFMGMIHRDNKPAEMYYYDDFLHSKKWYNYGLLHRDNKPAKIDYVIKNKKLFQIQYYTYGKLHRDNGPALINYFYDNNNIKNIFYAFYNNGLLHNLKNNSYYGPHIDESTKENIKIWSINGNIYTEYKFNKIMSIVYKFIYKLRNYRRLVIFRFINRNKLFLSKTKIDKNILNMIIDLL